jgi:hypothetical protein
MVLERKITMNTVKDVLEIVKDLLEIWVLCLTAKSLTKSKKSKKSKRK